MRALPEPLPSGEARFGSVVSLGSAIAATRERLTTVYAVEGVPPSWP